MSRILSPRMAPGPQGSVGDIPARSNYFDSEGLATPSITERPATGSMGSCCFCGGSRSQPRSRRASRNAKTQISAIVRPETEIFQFIVSLPFSMSGRFSVCIKNRYEIRGNSRGADHAAYFTATRSLSATCRILSNQFSASGSINTTSPAISPASSLALFEENCGWAKMTWMFCAWASCISFCS